MGALSYISGAATIASKITEIAPGRGRQLPAWSNNAKIIKIKEIFSFAMLTIVSGLQTCSYGASTALDDTAHGSGVMTRDS